MSHDQSPARVRVIGNRDATPARRRQDVAPSVVEAVVAAVPGRAPAGSRRMRVGLILLFLVACAIAGIAVARGIA